MTMYYLSRGYFQLRAALETAMRSPFVQAAGLAVLAILVWDRLFSADAAPEARVAAASVAVSGGAEGPRGADDRLLAWSILAARGSAGAAERAALEHLYAMGEPLDGLSFSGSGLDLGGVDLSIDGRAPASLRGCGFAGVRLAGADFARADLYSADFTGADLSGADLTYAQIDDGAFAGADLSAAALRRASMARAELDGVSAVGVDLRDADMSRATAVGARLDGALAMTSDWRGADLSRAVLRDADFSGARFHHARLDGAEISGASFLGAQGLDTASFSRAWAWSDRPPIGLPEGVRVDMCDPGPAGAARRAFLTRAVEADEGAQRPAGC